MTLHSELVCSLRGPGPNPTPDSHRGFPQGPLSTSPSVPRSLSSSLDLSSHTKERGLFNDKMLSQAVISSATLYLPLSQGNSLSSFVIRKKMGQRGAETTVNNT